MSVHKSLASKFLTVVLENSHATLTPVHTDFFGEHAQELDHILDQLPGHEVSTGILDLSHCSNISSDGLGSLARRWEQNTETGGFSMAVVLPRTAHSDVVNLFDITGLTRMMGGALQQSMEGAKNYLLAFAHDEIN